MYSGYLPRLLVACSLIFSMVEAQDVVPVKTTQGAEPQANQPVLKPQLTASPAADKIDPAKRQELMKERSALFQRMAPLRQEAMKDPEVQKLREDLTKAQKAYQDKIETLLANQPGYAETKTKIDAINQQLGMHAGGFGPRPSSSPFQPVITPPVGGPAGGSDAVRPRVDAGIGQAPAPTKP